MTREFISNAEARRFGRSHGIRECHVDEATDLIINTRDFCGNEREAVMELCLSFGLDKSRSEALYRIANFRANARWNEYQKAAGVPPKYTF